jgi:hypothetical protein
MKRCCSVVRSFTAVVVGFLQAWRGDETSLNVCAPPQTDFDDKGQPKNRLSRIILLISSEYHCNHPFASLANRKPKLLSWYRSVFNALSWRSAYFR